MHGPSFHGDGGSQLRGLAQFYRDGSPPRTDAHLRIGHRRPRLASRHMEQQGNRGGPSVEWAIIVPAMKICTHHLLGGHDQILSRGLLRSQRSRRSQPASLLESLPGSP